MTFLILIENLFIREGVKAILSAKYPDSRQICLEQFEGLSAVDFENNSMIISNLPEAYIHYQDYINQLRHENDCKMILLCSKSQMDKLKGKALESIDALIHTHCSLNDLNEALSHVQSGLNYRCKMMDENDSDSLNGFENILNSHEISRREREIIELIIQGKTSLEISEILHISYHTVSTHRKNINKKLNINNPQHLIRLSIPGSDENQMS